MYCAKNLIIAVSAVLLVFLAAGTAHAQEDTVWTGSAKYERVEIVSETYEFVEFRVAGARQIERTEDVVKIVHGGAPQRFLIAEQARKDGDWAEAARRYESCVRNERKKWVKTYSQFYLGECHRQWGETEPEKFKEAVRAYEQFLSQYGKHRFVPHATWGIAQAATDSRVESKARKAYEDLATGKYGTKWSLRGRLGLAKISFRKGEPASLDDLRAIAQDADVEGMTDIWADAKLLLAQALVKNGNTTEAAKTLKSILENPKGVPKKVLAQAHNMLGECCLKSAGPGSVKKALFEHLKVLVLYAALHEEYLKALKEAVKLLEQLGYKERAAELRSEYQQALQK